MLGTFRPWSGHRPGTKFVAGQLSWRQPIIIHAIYVPSGVPLGKIGHVTSTHSAPKTVES